MLDMIVLLENILISMTLGGGTETIYERDLYAWAMQNAALLRAGRFDGSGSHEHRRGVGDGAERKARPWEADWRF